MEHIVIKPVWPKSKDEIWKEVFEPLDERAPKKRFLSRIPVWGYAASLLIPVLLLCQFYTVSEATGRGEQAVVRLPDRSTVTMNADSKLSYKPFGWYLSRKVQLTGEACFEVTKGRDFSVLSGRTRVKVLGTTFNVYARAETYRITCLTGRVEVLAGNEAVVLHPNMQAVINEKIHVNSDVAPATATGWMLGMFMFAGTPLQEVIAEVERQYNIVVAPDYNPNHLYSGGFSKTEKPEEVLEIIGKPFDITFRFE